MPDILNSIFWIEVDKIKPNPLQPRREFGEDRLRDLAESIRQYGVLQPLVVTKHEIEREDGSLYSEYELIAGERRWRAANLAGVNQVPCVIRAGEDNDRLKLELAIIENLQREDLNPVDRARAFDRLINEFNLKHAEVAGKIGKSREYVSNSLRILSLTEEFLNAIISGQINEGHTRPLLMLAGKPAEQKSLFDEIVTRRLTVREAEAIARRIAIERARKRGPVDPALVALEQRLSERLGTRVQIERKEVGGKVTINYLSNEDLQNILSVLTAEPVTSEPELESEPEADLYNIKNFSI
ncbi:MAG: ParB/RepB/Spo0J family partition protein [Candidatus Vogelbacteria bacterium]|nr:ParB/RepB/Spo0J family partition protein [Candidatus Vogelbacteria bacterium]